jgi:parallel beta-helix repeat protein
MKLSTGLKLALLALSVLLLYSSATLRAQQPITLTVCPAGPPACHFQKIQDAINVAIEGSTIQVKAGTYAENLTIIYKRLTLQGEGRNQVTIQGTVAFLFTKGVTMSGFTIKDGRTVYIEENSEKVELKDNSIVGMALEGIRVRGAIAPITIQNNSINGSKSHGILLERSKVIQIIENQITDNNEDGIRLIKASQANIYKNTITSNIGFGVWVESNAEKSIVTGTGQFPGNVMCNWTGILGGGATFPKGFWTPNPIREQSLGHTSEVFAVAYSPYGCLLASGSWDNIVKVWDVAKGSEVRTLSEHRGPVKTVAFSPDGRLIASGSADNTIKLWEVVRLRDSVISSYRTLSGRDGHEGPVEAVAFSPCKQKDPSGTTCTQWDELLASSSFDKTIKVWEVATGNVRSTLAGHSGPIYSVVFSPDGKFLASGSDDNTIKLWDVDKKKEIKTFTGHTGPVFSVAFSPDGKLLASGSADGTVKLWEVATGKIQHSLSHDSDVRAVTFSSDGRLLASVSIDNTIKVWDIATGKVVYTFSHDGDVNAVAFNPICKQTSDAGCTQWELASGSDDKTIKLWKVDVK